MELPDSKEVQAQLFIRHLFSDNFIICYLTADHKVQLVCYISYEECYDFVKNIWSDKPAKISAQEMLHCVVMSRLPKHVCVTGNSAENKKTGYLENQLKFTTEMFMNISTA